MSLDKAIKHGKEKRKQYRGAKAVDRFCRNHGGEDWSLSNRTHKYLKSKISAEEKLAEEISKQHDYIK